MASLTCDVAIIGAGTAGIAAERSARRSGARTLLIDEAFAGTTCARVGCMPSKLLIAAARAAYATRRAPLFGVRISASQIDGPAVLARVRRERDAFVEGVLDDLDSLPEGVKIKARARFDGPTSLVLDDGRRVEAKAVVIAVGAAPNLPDIFDPVRQRVLTNETLFDLPDLPASVGVVGAGPLGLELAQALARLGVEVVLFDEGEAFGGLPRGAPSDALRTALEEDFAIHLGVKLEARAENDGATLAWFGKTSGQRRFDHVLVAAGRPPRLRDLGLETTGLSLDKHGAPRFDEHTLRCEDAPIFIAGDAAHDRPVLHEASATGAIAGHNGAAYPDAAPSRRFTPLAITFTDPPIAMVGEGHRPDDPDIVTGSASYAHQGRARVDATTHGAVELYARASTGQLAGAVMVGPGVDHTAHLIAWAVQRKLTATEVLQLPFYHPTVEEGLKPALLDICKAVGAEAPADRDDGFVAGT